MKAPFYVIDHNRKLVFGQFFEQASAVEVDAILKHHSVDHRIELFGADDYRVDIMLNKLTRGELRKGTEADLTTIQAARYLPESKYRGDAQMVKGAVITLSGNQFVLLGVATAGHKWDTWEMRGLHDQRPYKYKVPTHTSGRAVYVRMATPNEFHGARQQRAEINARKQDRRERNQGAADALNVQPGDVVIMNWSDVGERAEVVEDVNWKDGRIALRRRGYSAVLRQKRRFVSAVNVVSIKEKGPGYYRANNPMYAQYGF